MVHVPDEPTERDNDGGDAVIDSETADDDDVEHVDSQSPRSVSAMTQRQRGHVAWAWSTSRQSAVNQQSATGAHRHRDGHHRVIITGDYR